MVLYIVLHGVTCSVTLYYSDLNLQSIVPFTQLRYKTSWVQKIFNQYKKISNDVQVNGKLVQQEQMQYNFLLICWNLTVYGSAFFEALLVGKVCVSMYHFIINLHVILEPYV